MLQILPKHSCAKNKRTYMYMCMFISYIKFWFNWAFCILFGNTSPKIIYEKMFSWSQILTHEEYGNVDSGAFHVFRVLWIVLCLFYNFSVKNSEVLNPHFTGVDFELKNCPLQRKSQSSGIHIKMSPGFVRDSVNHHTEQTLEKQEFKRLTRMHCFSKHKYQGANTDTLLCFHA